MAPRLRTPSIGILGILGLLTSTLAGGENGDATPLPHPKEFDASRYLGKWYEAARMPAAAQPPDSLATAEYSLAENEGHVIVKNTALRLDGSTLGAFEGKARLVEGGDPGRLAVSFGDSLPDEPNYNVMFVDKTYRHAVVGTRDRKSLWILTREVPIRKKKLDRLLAIAKEVGFDTEKLLIADWSRAAPLPHPKTFDPARYLGKWYEAARTPTPVQPEGSLAIAEYTATDEPGRVRVRNTALDAEGDVLSTIGGRARIVTDAPPGRLAVTFGKEFPDGPNYYVLHVDKEYRHALIGTPSRESLRILSREVPVRKKTLDRLMAIAERYGFDTERLIVGDWSKVKVESDE